MSVPCDCEHADHFDGDYDRVHEYMQEEAVETVGTTYGNFHYCSACIATHKEKS